jgi:histone acetyltransferase (RNA polymerase elongator complex component)
MFKFICSKEKPLIIPIFIVNEGCANICAFCNQKNITGTKGVKVQEIDSIVGEYLGFSKKREKVELSFYGGSFTALPTERMNAFVEKGKALVEKGVVNSLRCSTRPDAIDEKIAKHLKENHFETVELGVQTMSDKLLNKMKRGHTAATVYNAVETLKKYKIKTVVQLMSGYPYENKEDLDITMNALDLLKPDYLRIYPFVPICDTEIHDDIERGLVKMNSVDEIIEKSAKIFIRAMGNNIPVIRIGLPLSGDIPDIYPHNLFQVVVHKAIEILAEKGEKEFVLPKEWVTSFNMAKRKYPEITGGEQ